MWSFKRYTGLGNSVRTPLKVLTNKLLRKTKLILLIIIVKNQCLLGTKTTHDLWKWRFEGLLQNKSLIKWHLILMFFWKDNKWWKLELLISIQEKWHWFESFDVFNYYRPGQNCENTIISFKPLNLEKPNISSLVIIRGDWGISLCFPIFENDPKFPM